MRAGTCAGLRVRVFFFEGPFPTAGTARIPVLGGASGWGLCSEYSNEGS